MTAEIQFPDAKFYTCDDSAEELKHDDPWPAIEEFLENSMEPGITPAQVEALCREAPVTVYGYIETPISDDTLKLWADGLKEALYEAFNDEYGDMNYGTPLHQDADKILLEAVTKIIRATPVWACEMKNETVVPGEQVLEMARKERPDWFEEEA